MADIDWCAEAEALRKARRDLATGMAVSQVTYDDKSVSYTKADLPRLDALIAEAEAEAEMKCDLSSGTRKLKRFAMGARFKPY